MKPNREELERVHYNGLTTADKGALLDAKANGAEWIARDENGMICGYATKPSKYNRTGEWYTDDGFELITKLLKFIKWSDHEPVNIDLALAQIAEMESKQNNALSEKAIEKGCMTWNERINQMTVEEKADVAVIMSRRCSDALSKKICPDMTCWQCFIEYLNSPYTEGATK